VSSQSRGNRSATLEEVALRAGVSRATASRVLRGESNVSAAASEAVRRAAEEINYVPNLAARSLVTGRSESIAFLVNETEERLFTEPFFLAMLRSAQGAVTSRGLQLSFVIASSREQRERFISYASGGHVDGVLLLSVHRNDHFQQQLEARGVPTVLSGRPQQDHSLYYVDADNVRGGELAVNHLLKAGRQRIGIVTGDLDVCSGEDRLAGYRAAMLEAGRQVDGNLIELGGFSTVEGYAAARRLLERCPDVDAIVAGSDLAAIGVMRALRQAGRSVPGDVAVVGFDDIPAAAEHDPALTTVRQPMNELGATMAEVLLRRLDGSAPDAHGVVLPVEMVVRASA